MAARLYIFLLGLAFALGAVGCDSGTSSESPKSQVFHTPRLLGTFESQERMTDGQWRASFQAMRAAGLTQVVVSHAADATAMTTRYPTALPGFSMVYPSIPAAFPNATHQNIDVYLGLQSSDDWWASSTDPTWLAAQATLSNQVADELFRAYGAEPAFKGWYLPFEVDNVTFPTSVEWDLLVGYYTTVVGHLHTLAPGKPVIIAPFFNPSFGLDSTRWRTMWAYILARAPIDIIALQDGVGAGNTTIDVLPEWFQATKSAIGDAGAKCQLWSDTETFNIADWSTMPIKGIAADLAAEAPFVSGTLSWSFLDYLDPHTVNPLYYRTYLEYATTGQLDTEAPSIPTGMVAKAADSNDVILTWTPSVDNLGVVAYDLDRNGTVTRLYQSAGIYADSGLDPGTAYTYKLAAVDAAGNVSPASAPQSVTTPVDPVYPTNLAAGRPYTTSSPADPGHPDPGNTGLTDGIYGANDAFDPAWQGRTTAGNTWVVDLGSVQTLHEVNSSWLRDEANYILLPISVAYAISQDGVTFQPLGTVTPGVLGASVWHKVFKLNRLDVQARYIQVTAMTIDGDWSFIDEIEVRQ